MQVNLGMALDNSLQGLDKTKKGSTTELFLRGVVGVAPPLGNYINCS